MHQFFRSEFFNFELVRILGSAPLGGCDIAEFLDAVGMIKQDDALSWHNAWYLQAEKAESIAKDASRSGDRASARRAYLRASNYFRASQYMMHDRTECHNDLVLPPTERSIANFKLAAKLLDGHVHELAIPFEGHQLPGYLFLPPPAKRLPGKIPVMINTGGADSTQEELYYLLPAAGPDLGYAVLTFEGPGQGIVLRRDKLYQRLDWEVVTGRVLDHLFQFSAAHVDLELDLERVSISGASMGGHYAIRGASDLRIKACVAMDPFYDMWELALFDAFPSSIRFPNPLGVNTSTWLWGLQTPARLLRKMQQYTLRLQDGGEFLDRVRCSVFISGAAHSLYFDPKISTTKIYDKLTHIPENKKRVWIPKAPGDGGLQAKMGALSLSSQQTFQFLDEQFGIEREELLA